MLAYACRKNSLSEAWIYLGSSNADLLVRLEELMPHQPHRVVVNPRADVVRLTDEKKSVDSYCAGAGIVPALVNTIDT